MNCGCLLSSTMKRAKNTSPAALKAFAAATGFSTPELHDMTLEEARHNTLIDDLQVTDNGNIEGKITNEEGYVLTWYRDGIDALPIEDEIH